MPASDVAERGAPVGGGDGEEYEDGRTDGAFENAERADAYEDGADVGGVSCLAGG